MGWTRMTDVLERELGAAGYSRIDLRRGGTGQLLATVRIGSGEALMILDSGASATVVDRESADRIGLTELAPGEGAAGAGGRLETHVVDVGSVSLGEVAVQVDRLCVMDLSHVNDQLLSIGEPRVDGVLGSDVLSQHAALIDYSAPRLYLR